MRARLLTIGGATLLLSALVLLAISRYDWNASTHSTGSGQAPLSTSVSALLHVSREFGEAYAVPKGIVLMQDGGYDGMLYYQIARDLPMLLAPRSSPQASEVGYENAYRMQRILLPLLAFVLSLGNDRLLPFVILSINLIAVLGSFALLLALIKRPTIHTWTIVGNPAALVGILFSLTEPLALFLTTAFLLLFLRNGQRLNAIQLILLALAMFARETTIVLLGLLTLFFLLKKDWKQVLLALTPLLPFALWELLLTLRLGALPLATGTGMVNVPLSGPLALLFNTIQEPTVVRLSSLSFILLFVLPLFAWQIKMWTRERTIQPLQLLLTGLTAILFSLDAHIWGAITSVGRVIPALYPVYALWALEHDTVFTRTLSVTLVTISTVTALGIALIPHPFTIS